MFVVTIAMLMYLLWVWPFESNFYTYIEVMNEVTALVMLYVMLTFSAWVPSATFRYTLGWLFIGVCSLNIAIHLLFLIGDLVKQKIRKCKRCLASRRARKAAEKRTPQKESKEMIDRS